MVGVFLDAYLAPLAELLARSDITDIFVNRPGQLWIETRGGAIERHDAPALDEPTIMRLARQIAALTHQAISREHPLLSATLPDGARIQIVAPPATRGPPAIAIRKHISSNLTLDHYASVGAFEGAAAGRSETVRDVIRNSVEELLVQGDHVAALRAAVQGRLNILISGGTSTGKTTFLNALLAEIPAHERLIFIEDTPELQFGHENAVGLIATRSELGESSVTANDLVTASLRMRPDRILLGELRGNEAFAFLRAVNTGHPGSMTTIHADSVEGAFEQLALLVLQGGTRLQRDDILSYAQTTIGLVVQLHRNDGVRGVSEMRLIRSGS
ncbi:P-type DNA transfer ATPase VirB11 [Sphingomonas sp. RB1R13]|uniref:P-type DNA transfer ATPase VirB11 n=1 Tax=Sphingomonas sp. RB1R13 TaxID=3096159 RepID=UPI002FCB44D5